MGFLWQEAPVDESATIGELLDEYTAELRAIERELEDAAANVRKDKRRYERALEAAESAELWSLDQRRVEILAALGIHNLGLDTRVGTISGGQRSRVPLAGLLLSRPDALILDEPTNHLDDAATELVDLDSDLQPQGDSVSWDRRRRAPRHPEPSARARPAHASHPTSPGTEHHPPPSQEPCTRPPDSRRAGSSAE